MYPSSAYDLYSYHHQEYESNSLQNNSSEEVQQLIFNHDTVAGSSISPRRPIVGDSVSSWNNQIRYTYPAVSNVIFPDSNNIDIHFQPHQYSLNVFDNYVPPDHQNDTSALGQKAFGNTDSPTEILSIATTSTSISSSTTPNPVVDSFIHEIMNLRTVSPESVPQLFGQIPQGFHCKLSNCTHPYKTFRSVQAVMDHIHMEDLPKCKPKAVWCNCNKWLSSEGVGKRHATTCNEGEQHKCPDWMVFSAKWFKRADEVLAHMRARHSKDPKLSKRKKRLTS